MQREVIKEKIGLIEEKLERLHRSSEANALARLQGTSQYQFADPSIVSEIREDLIELQNTIQTESLKNKSLTVKELQQRIVRYLIAEARAQDLEIALSYFGTGKVSLETLELVMGAVMACVKASMRSYLGMGLAYRMREALFHTASVHLEAHANNKEVYFKIVSDGMGFQSTLRAQFEANKQFELIRRYLFENNGWFNSKSFAGYGGMLEFKLPLPTGRIEALLVRGGGIDVVVPSYCVSEVMSLSRGVAPDFKGLPVFKIDEKRGLARVSHTDVYSAALKISIADVQAWILCEKKIEKTTARKVNASEYLQEGSWYVTLASFYKEGNARILPLLDGNIFLRNEDILAELG